jgi:hypothetical protein
VILIERDEEIKDQAVDESLDRVLGEDRIELGRSDGYGDP